LRSYNARGSSAWVTASGTTASALVQIIAADGNAPRDIRYWTLVGGGATTVTVTNVTVNVGGGMPPLLWNTSINKFVNGGIAAGGDETMRTWDVDGANGATAYTFTTPSWDMSDLQQTPDHTRIYMCATSSISANAEFGYFDTLGGTWAWNQLFTGGNYRAFEMDYVAGLMWTHDRGASTKQISRRTLSTGASLDSYTYATPSIANIAYDIDGDRLFVALTDNTIDVFDASDLASGPTATVCTGWTVLTSGSFMHFDIGGDLLYLTDPSGTDDEKVWSLPASATGQTKAGDATELLDAGQTLYGMNLAVT